MYFTLKGITKEKENALAELLAPKIELEGGTVITASKDGDGYSCGELYVTDSVKCVKDGLFEIKRTIKNNGAFNETFKDILTVNTLFEGQKYLIPCILYNGNEHGSSNTPKSLKINGEPWIFAYDRLGIPSCTVTENKDAGLALFAGAESEASLVSSCSLTKLENGCYEHRIIRPVTEAPYTYSSKNVMTERYDTYHTLEPGKTIESVSYVFVCRPRWENYACADLIDTALEVLDPKLPPCLTPTQVFDLGISFTKDLLYEYKGHKLIITHYAPRLFRFQHGVRITLEEMAKMLKDPYYTELGKFDERFEMGWADHNLMNARMLAIDAFAKDDKELLADAIGIFDAFAATQKENGLAFTLFEQNYMTPERSAKRPPDCCNLGWGITEMVKMYRLLKAHGIEKPEYLKFAKGVSDFFVEHYSEEYGFGKSFFIDGTPDQTLGSVGGFMVAGILDWYEECGDKKYLDCAIKALDFYYKRDLDDFVCTAGALDCQSIDKETAYPFVVASLALYRITGNKLYLERAEKAAYYFTSWMFFYDVLYKDECEFKEYGYHTTGGTAISAEHHAIDSWGSIIVPELCEIADITGEKKWIKIAQLMWANAIQGITEREGQLTHGVQRPLGGQNEGFFQARWTKYRPTCELRGHFNDCLPGWVSAYRMLTVDRMRNSGKIEIIE